FPITLAVLAGVRQVNPHLVTVARAYGAGTLAVFGRVMLPSMLFTLAGGLRTGLALCAIGGIVGEIRGARALGDCAPPGWGGGRAGKPPRAQGARMDRLISRLETLQLVTVLLTGAA